MNRLLNTSSITGSAWELIAREHAGAMPLTLREEARAACGRGEPGARGLQRCLLEVRATAHRLDRHRFDDKLLAAVDETELRAMGALERGFHFRLRWRGLPAARRARERESWNNERGVGAGISNMCTREDLDPVRCDVLACNLTDRLPGERAADPRDRCDRLDAHRLLDRLLAGGADIGEPHAVGGQ